MFLRRSRDERDARTFRVAHQGALRTERRRLRRSFVADVLECPKCHGRLRVVAVITELETVRRILAHLGVPTDAPLLARARDPTDDDLDDVEPPGQFALGLGSKAAVPRPARSGRAPGRRRVPSEPINWVGRSVSA